MKISFDVNLPTNDRCIYIIIYLYANDTRGSIVFVYYDVRYDDDIRRFYITCVAVKRARILRISFSKCFIIYIYHVIGFHCVFSYYSVSRDSTFCFLKSVV